MKNLLVFKETLRIQRQFSKAADSLEAEVPKDRVLLQGLKYGPKREPGATDRILDMRELKTPRTL